MQRRNFFREISCNKMELGEIQAQAGRLGISLSCGRCRMASFKIESLKAMDENSISDSDQGMVLCH